MLVQAMTFAGIIVGVVIVAIVLFAMLFDWDAHKPHPHESTNEDQMAALGRVVDHARRMNDE